MKNNEEKMQPLEEDELEGISGGNTEHVFTTRLNCRACKHSAMVSVDPVTRLGKCPNCGKEYLCHIPF